MSTRTKKVPPTKTTKRGPTPAQVDVVQAHMIAQAGIAVVFGGLLGLALLGCL